MHPRILKIFLEAESLRTEVLRMVQPLTDDKLFQSRQGKWSISQILWHVIEAERLSLQYMKKKSLGIRNVKDSTPVDDFKFLLLKVSQRLPLKFKAPAVLSQDEPPSLTLSEIETQWEATRTDLKKFLETFDETTVKRKIYRHVIAGRLNVMHAVEFFNEHLNHHLPQIKRLL
jgi:uncharacterized damage-inducible protein DinB